MKNAGKRTELFHRILMRLGRASSNRRKGADDSDQCQELAEVGTGGKFHANLAIYAILALFDLGRESTNY